MEKKLTQGTIVIKKVRSDIFNNVRCKNDPCCHEITLQQRATAPDIDVNRLVSKATLAKANSFIQQLQR